jgi:L-ribulokinase
MSIAAGVDFGTTSVRVSIFSSDKGRLGAGVASYPLARKQDDPDYATQSHSDHMRALTEAMAAAIGSAAVDGQSEEAQALNTTGSSFIPLNRNLEPSGD